MKHNNAILTIGGLLVLVLGCTSTVLEFTGLLDLTVDKTVYALEDTIQVTLHNNSDQPVYLEGCSQLYLATETDTGWVEGPLVVCVWEGYAVRIDPDSVFTEKHPAKHFLGVHKFVAPVYYGCGEGKPISQAECMSQAKIYSPEFTVAGDDSAAGNLDISVQKSEYQWTPEDLGASRQIQATIRNNSTLTYFSKLGDGFNSSIDQDNLFVADGSGASIERFNPDGMWSAMPRDLLIEGTRFVALRPQTSYRLTAAPLYLWRGDESGQFRFKVEYFDRVDPSPEISPKVDYSNIFTIR